MTVPLPTPYTLQRRTYAGTGSDSHGNDVDTWADPVDWPVHAYASGANDEPAEQGRDLSNVLWTVYAPADGNAPGARDRVVLEGVEYAIEGQPRDYSHDPWQHRIGGVVVYLKNPEG